MGFSKYLHQVRVFILLRIPRPKERAHFLKFVRKSLGLSDVPEVEGCL